MSKQNKTAAFKALNTFADSRVKLIESMKSAGYPTIEACREVVIEWACEKTGAEYRIAESSGMAKLVSSHPKYEAAKTTVRDIMLMLQGTTRHAESKRSEPTKVRISAEERAAFAALLAACGDAKRLSTVVKALNA